MKEENEDVVPLIPDFEFYPLNLAALKVGLGVRHLTNAINDGELKAFRQGKKLFVYHSDLSDYIRKGGDALETKPKSNL